MPSWILFSLLGYFLSACATTIDKIILSHRIPNPATYAFYVGIFSIGALVLAPFGFSLISFDTLAVAFLSGALFLFGLFFIFKAVRLWEVSRVAVAVGGFSTITIFLGSAALWGERLSAAEGSALLLLLIAGIILVFEKGEWITFRRDLVFDIVLASIFLGLSFVTLKLVFLNTEFINGVIWTRISSFVVALGFLAIPNLRREIFEVSQTIAPASLIYAFGSKVIAGLGFFSINYAVALGSATIVNALKASEYAFVFLLTAVMTLIAPKILSENMSVFTVAQKVLGIILVIIGIMVLYANA